MYLSFVLSFLPDYLVTVMMNSLKLETFLINYLFCPTAQDNFSVINLRLLLNQHYDNIDIDHTEDVIQILYKCITELEKLQATKFKQL